MASDTFTEEEHGLVPRRKAFCEEYMRDFNGKAAAIRVGYAPDSAEVEASRLLSDDKVSAYVEKLKADRAARIGVSVDEIVNEVSILANASLEHYIVTDDGYLRAAPGAPPGVMRAVQSCDRKSRVYKDKEGNTTYVEYEIKFKLWDKPGQLKLLGRHVGAKFATDKVELSGPNGGPIPITEIRTTIVDPKEPT